MMAGGGTKGRRRLLRVRLAVVVVALVGLLGVDPGRGECPPGAQILERLAALELRRASQTASLAPDPPVALYQKAVKKPGQPVTERHGKEGRGVVIAAVAAEKLWLALNDEDHQVSGGYVPLRHSQVLEGESHGSGRLIFQYFKKAGLGRWWISTVEMNRELWRASEGGLWELHWEDRIRETDYGDVVAAADPGVPPLEASRGAWLLVPMGKQCTVLEYTTWSDPGGFLGLAQSLVARRALRDTLRGIVRMATEHSVEPHDEPFVRPDGSLLRAVN